MNVRGRQASSSSGIKPQSEPPEDVVGVQNVEHGNSLAGAGCVGSNLGSGSDGPLTLDSHVPSVGLRFFICQGGREKALTKLIQKCTRKTPRVSHCRPSTPTSSQMDRWIQILPGCAITHGRGEPKGLSDPFQPGTPPDEAGWSFIITEFSLDQLLTPFDPLLPQLSMQIITQPAEGCRES